MSIYLIDIKGRHIPDAYKFSVLVFVLCVCPKFLHFCYFDMYDFKAPRSTPVLIYAYVGTPSSVCRGNSTELQFISSFQCLSTFLSILRWLTCRNLSYHLTWFYTSSSYLEEFGLLNVWGSKYNGVEFWTSFPQTYGLNRDRGRAKSCLLISEW